MYSINIEISQVRPVPFFAKLPKHLLKLKVASGTGDNLMGLNMDNLLIKTAFSFVAFLLLHMRCTRVGNLGTTTKLC